MEHTFPGGIKATSHDGAGDEFLRGMIREAELEEGPTPQEREIVRLRDDFREAVTVIKALVIEAGGKAKISDLSMAEAYGKELVEQRRANRSETPSAPSSAKAHNERHTGPTNRRRTQRVLCGDDGRPV